MGPPEAPDSTSVYVHGPALRVIRQLLNVKVPDICEALHCTPGYVSKLETGRSRRCSPLFFAQLLAFLGLNTAEGRRALLAFPFESEPLPGDETVEMARPITDPSGIPIDVLDRSAERAPTVPGPREPGRHRRAPAAQR